MGWFPVFQKPSGMIQTPFHPTLGSSYFSAIGSGCKEAYQNIAIDFLLTVWTHESEHIMPKALSTKWASSEHTSLHWHNHLQGQGDGDEKWGSPRKMYLQDCPGTFWKHYPWVVEGRVGKVSGVTCGRKETANPLCLSGTHISLAHHHFPGVLNTPPYPLPKKPLQKQFCPWRDWHNGLVSQALVRPVGRKLSFLGWGIFF